MIRSSQKLFCTALAIALLAGTGFCEDTGRVEEDEKLVLGEEDLAERGEIARNMFRRITPGDEPLVQDVGTWPVAWEEFAPNWAAAAVGREYGAWVVPFSLAQESGATVIRDANDTVLWRGETDFAKPESASVTLLGGLVAEEDWDACEGVRNWVESNARLDDTPSRGATYTNGLRFTSVDVETNGTVDLSLAWEEDGDVDIFAYLLSGIPSTNVVTWTNDENQVVTTTNTVWEIIGENLSGFDNAWEWRGMASVTNGEGIFTDSGAAANPVRMGFYAAAEANDTDGDGLNDGFESFVHHTDPENTDSDGDGWTDGEETTAGTNPLDRLDAPRPARGVLIHAVKYSTDTSNQWAQLHCSGPREVDVGGFRLQAAGTNWETQVLLPEGTWMAPGHFLLVGGGGVSNADVTAELALAGTYSNAPTAGVRLMPPEGATNGPVDVVMYAQNTLFNANGLDTTGWLSESTNLWASESCHLARWNLGDDTDADADWHDAADSEDPANAGTVLDSDGDGLLDGFEAAHGLDPTNGDTDGDGTPDGEEHDGNGGLYFWAQFADGVAVTAVTPSKAGWRRGESIGSNGTVRFEFANLDGVALWATFEDGGHQREPFTLSATHATIRYESELELVEWPLWRKTALIVPDDGAATFSVTVADDRNGNPVTNEVYMGVDLAPWFDAVKLDVSFANPDDENWTELEESRVVLDDEDLRIKIGITPQFESLAQCRQLFDTSLTVKTSGTCPAGVAVPIPEDAAFVASPGKSEIRMSKTRQQLQVLGLLPAQDEDDVNEMAWIDIVETEGQSLADSEAFSALGYAFRGKATLDVTKTLESAPPNSVPSQSFFKAAGCEIVSAEYDGVTSKKRQIMNQADVFYCSGHASGTTGGVSGGFTPALLGEYWKQDLNCVVIAGCSVLNIAGHRIKSFGIKTRFRRWLDHREDSSVGVSWENAADIIFLGYCYTAPLDSQGAVAIASDFATKVKEGKNFLQAWKESNDRDVGRNACAIDCTANQHKFWYWDETSGSPVWTCIYKGATSW